MCCCDTPGKCACGMCRKPKKPSHYDPSDLVSVSRGSYDLKKGEKIVPRHAGMQVFSMSGDRIHGGHKFDGQSEAAASYVPYEPDPTRFSPPKSAAPNTKPPIKFDATSNYAGSFVPPATTAYQRAQNTTRHLDASQSAFLSGAGQPFDGTTNHQAEYIAYPAEALQQQRPSTASGQRAGGAAKSPIKFVATSTAADSYAPPPPEVIAANRAADRSSRSPRKQAYTPNNERFNAISTTQNDYKEYELPPPTTAPPKSGTPQKPVPFTAISQSASAYGPPPVGYRPPSPYKQSVLTVHQRASGAELDPAHYLSESRSEFGVKPLPSRPAVACNKCGCVCPKDSAAAAAGAAGAGVAVTTQPAGSISAGQRTPSKSGAAAPSFTATAPVPVSAVKPATQQSASKAGSKPNSKPASKPATPKVGAASAGSSAGMWAAQSGLESSSQAARW